MTATAAARRMATGIEHVIDQYIAAWNETNPGARRELIARTWTADGSYLDPLLSGAGHDGIDAMIGGVQSQFPGYRFRRVGELDAHNNVVRFSWELGPEDGPSLAGGVDFGVIADGRLQSITDFLDFAPGASGQQEGRLEPSAAPPSTPHPRPFSPRSGEKGARPHQSD